MSIPRELVRELRRLDEFELRRVLILVRGLLLHVDGAPEADEVGLPPTLTYRQEHVRCGKDRCRTCPHGPYWYAYWKEDGRTRKRYIGRQLPGEELDPVIPDAAGPRDATRSESTDGSTSTAPPPTTEASTSEASTTERRTTGPSS